MITEYHKIHSLFKRDDRGDFTEECSLPEFDYLFFNSWTGTEKIDGTNIRIHWNGKEVSIKGKTNKAHIPTFLYNRLSEIVNQINFEKLFPEQTAVTLYGEGYGSKIQKIGKLYNPFGVDFILFDVKIGKWWLTHAGVESIARDIGISNVPIVFMGSLDKAIQMVLEGFPSVLGTFPPAEGLVLTPTVPLFNRKGRRIITKLKTKDFKYKKEV